MRYLISAFSFYNNRTTIAMFNGLVQIFKFFHKDLEESPEARTEFAMAAILISDQKLTQMDCFPK